MNVLLAVSPLLAVVAAWAVIASSEQGGAGAENGREKLRAIDSGMGFCANQHDGPLLVQGADGFARRNSCGAGTDDQEGDEAGERANGAATRGARPVRRAM